MFCFKVVASDKVHSNTENFLAFSPLTLVPIQKSLVDKTLLSHEEASLIFFLSAFLKRFPEISTVAIILGKKN